MNPTPLVRRAARLLWAACLAAVVAGPAAAQAVQLQGTIYDAGMRPIPGCRIVVRELDGTDVFVSAPSNEAGTWTVDVPAGDNYLIVAAVSPTGGRVAVPDAMPIEGTGTLVTRDIHLPVSTEPGPRHAAKELHGSDRLFLSFVEDPLMVDRHRYEVRVEAADFDLADRLDVRAIGAWQIPGLPRIEFGVRAGYASLDTDFPMPEDSGFTDTDVWGKFHMRRSATGRTDYAVGAVATLPTGDDEAALGADTVQSKPFFAVSHAFRSAVVVGQAGVRFSGNGTIAGVPVDGEVAPSAGLAVVVPFDSRWSLIFEGAWEGERFEGMEPDGRVLAGVNWRPIHHGTLRAAVTGGLTDGSPDTALLVGWAFDY